MILIRTLVLANVRNSSDVVGECANHMGYAKCMATANLTYNSQASFINLRSRADNMESCSLISKKKYS